MYHFPFIAIVCLLFLTSCLSIDTPEQPNNVDPATLAGYALFHQSCGAAPANPDSPCPSIPAQVPLKLEDQSNPGNFSQIEPDATGYFEIQSLPGSYVIKLLEENDMMSAPPKVVLLKAGEKTEVTFRVHALTQ